MMKIKYIIILHLIIPLLIGGFIYISFRSNTLILFNISDDISDSFQTVRNLTLPYRKSIPNWIIYSLPDFIWAYTFTTAIILINQDKFRTFNRYCLLLLMVVLTHEILQLFHIVRGNFDIIDLSLEASAFFVSFLLFKPLEQEYSNDELILKTDKTI